MCLKYTYDNSIDLPVNPKCVETGSAPLLNVTLSKNGDDTVPTASALWMSTTLTLQYT